MNSGLGFVMEIPSFSLINAKKELAENIDYYRWWTLFSLPEQAMEDGIKNNNDLGNVKRMLERRESKAMKASQVLNKKKQEGSPS